MGVIYNKPMVMYCESVTIKRLCVLLIILFFMSEQSILKSTVTLSETLWWHIE